jgi:predicted nucleic acid-binding protein
VIYVLDASVLVKWFVEESDTPHALAVKQGYVEGAYEVASLDFALLEVANALQRSKGFSAAEILRCCEELYTLELDLVALVPDLIHAAIEVAARYHLTVYDAAYLALAKELDAQLITADRTFHTAVASLRHSTLLVEFDPTR